MPWLTGAPVRRDPMLDRSKQAHTSPLSNKFGSSSTTARRERQQLTVRYNHKLREAIVERLAQEVWWSGTFVAR